MTKVTDKTAGSVGKDKASVANKASSRPIGDVSRQTGDKAKTSKINPDIKVAADKVPPMAPPILEIPNLTSKGTTATSISISVPNHGAPQPVKYPFKVELVKRAKLL